MTCRRPVPVVGLVPRTYRHSPDCGIFRTEVSLYRGCVELRLVRPPARQVGGGPRGAVTVFSRRSRRSLLSLIARAGAPPDLMLTLTYAGDVTPAQAKNDLRVWVQSLVRVAHRAGIRVGVVWRLETTRAGRPHFHVLVWVDGSPRARLVPCLSRGTLERGRREYSRLRKRRKTSGRRPSGRWCDWTAAASCLWVERSRLRGGSADELLRRSVDVTFLANGRQAAYYAAKYTAKVAPGARVVPAPGPAPAVGRHWGRGGDRELFAPRVWARCTVPNVPGRIEGLVQELRDDGQHALALLIEDRLARIVAFALDDARDALWRLLGRWAVPKLRHPEKACHHDRCAGTTSLRVWAF